MNFHFVSTPEQRAKGARTNRIEQLELILWGVYISKQ